MNLPGDRRYSEGHVWVKEEAAAVRLGLTQFACEQLGAAEYVELPRESDPVTKDSPFAAVETSKAVTELVAPVSGKVLEANLTLKDAPQTLMEDPYGAGWLVTLQVPDPLDDEGLMSAEEYRRAIEG